MNAQSGVGIPPLAPQFVLPWTLPDASGQPIGLSCPLLRDLLVPALTLAMLAAMVLAAFIFMHPMTSLTGGRERKRGEPMPFELPDWAVFYEFSSPLFFGAAEQAFAALDRAAR
ncbi:MAG: hypothetical protein ACP5IY_03300 [Halothiobacillaceae bacterium]